MMRQAINENRTVQLVLVAILALAGGFLLLKTTKGSGNSSSPPAASAGDSAAPPSPSTSTDPSTAPSTTAAPAVSGASAGAVPVNLVPGPGLPNGLLDAYHHGKAIVLLVRRAGGTDDNLVRGSVEGLKSHSRVRVYVTKAKHISRYAWLTQGVDVTELPALVVLRPRGLTNGVPTATVSYGFRDAASVVQAVDDALYQGSSKPYYHP
jgi:hypothetical protein